MAIGIPNLTRFGKNSAAQNGGSDGSITGKGLARV
jgi:hypothetical protein